MVMAQTFDIRFARSAGLAALVEVPGNRFHWKGGGQLRIDAKSISFTVKRGLRTLFAGNRTRRILAENLREVYREGEALRVEFQTDETARVVLPFWAGDRDIAAQIVRLMPTSHTVEIEHATNSATPRADWRMLLSLGAALAAIAVGTWAAYQRTQTPVTTTTPPPSERAAIVETLAPASIPGTAAVAAKTAVPPAPAAAPWYEAPAIPLDPYRRAFAARPAAIDSSNISATPDSQPTAAQTSGVDASPRAGVAYVSPEGIVPFVPDMSEYAVARRQLDLFIAESDTLHGLSSSAEDWWKVAVRVSNSPDFEDPALKPLQEIELAVTRAWRRAHLMSEDSALYGSAAAEVEFAEMLEARARQFVR
jgi:hypothetical protein